MTKLIEAVSKNKEGVWERVKRMRLEGHPLMEGGKQSGNDVDYMDCNLRYSPTDNAGRVTGRRARWHER